ncbi:3-hydroxyacyl-CoA dehydrogenase family protein [Marinivivus vitaminiproducens]|uniref:3-hydroxyacyl-CoA dehydrogenase family protein n=1 Tax=Marinivivus vitaminiproducens TaxID=3035935 RepID=UPI00279968E3|nr:3-hydroxyacyl-CoA dehydrogenase family protein [Geminicoccaceae bacterium SCSIO 64248]
MTDIAVVGAGIMGHALALVFALGGHKVRLTDSHGPTLERAPGLIDAAARTLVEAGEIDAAWTDGRLDDAITPCGRLSDTVARADVIVEAIVERRDAKQALFAQIDEMARPDAILASNTSNLDIFPLVPASRQKRTLIAHWYTPPYLIDLVDIVPGAETEPAVVETMRDLVTALGKKPVVFRKFIAGYVANRIQEAIWLEVCRLLDDGVVSAREIDDSVIHGLALRLPILGVLAKGDFTGVDLLQLNLGNMPYTPPEVTGRSATVDRLIAEGRTGVKAGKGFFDWGGREARELFRERDRRILKLKQALRGIGPMEGA